MKRIGLALVLAVVMTGAATGQTWNRTPAARLLEIKGKATILDPENFDRPAAVYGTVYGDDRLVVAQGASAVLVFRSDGHIERITAPGTFKISQNGCQPKKGVEVVAVPEKSQPLVGKVSKGPRGIVQGGVTLVRAPPPASASEKNNSAASPPPDDNNAPPEEMLATRITPIIGSTVLSPKPTFSWPEVPKAETYTLKLYFLGNQVWTVTTNTNRLQYAGDTPLKGGATYTWDVSAKLNGRARPVCEGAFTTATDAQRADAAAFVQLLAKPEVPFLALAGLWYEQHGFAAEATATNEQLVKLAPSPEIYYALAGQYQQAGRAKDSEAAAKSAAELEAKGEEK